MAYILGYFAADGSMIKSKSGGCFIEFTTTDRCMVMLLKKITGAHQRITIRSGRNVNWKDQYRVQVGSRIWFSDLSNLGFTPAKSKSLTLPSIPNEFIGDFVRGYFDGDGCIYFKKLKYADRSRKRWILMSPFTSGSQPFLVSLWRELKRLGVRGGTIQKKNRGFELKFSFLDSLALHRLMYHTPGISSLFLPRKRRKLEKAIEILKLRA